jgi:3-deoxy-D-manno-octulosonic-acid transferase
MTRFTYTLILRILAPVLWIWMALRARRSGGNWGVLSLSRFGRYRPSESTPLLAAVWVHAVSLGETRAAQPLVQLLLEIGLPVLLTHTTATGREEGARLFARAIDDGQLHQAWLPYDFPASVRRFLEYFNPRCAVLIEREVWPNLIRESNRKNIPIALVSGRLSEQSLRQMRWMSPALREAYRGLDLVLAQTEDDVRRLLLAGVRAANAVGNLKFDVSLSPRQIASGRAWRQALGRPVIAIASTREGEDALFIGALASMREGGLGSQAGPILYLLIPRHPQRFEEAAGRLKASGLSFVRRFASMAPEVTQADVLLGDSLGEMAFYYAASDIAIVAGGFKPLGGQNLIEACASGTPAIVGPYMFNFAQATDDAVAAGAALQVENADAALKAAKALISDDATLQMMRTAAQSWATSHAGAARRIMYELKPWLEQPGTLDKVPCE